MSDPQRHVVPADIAEQMFPQHHPDSYHPAYDFSPPSITWLVGPIDCAECEGHGEITYPEWEGEFERCQDCDGLGYPPTVEIVSYGTIPSTGAHYPLARPHGVVKLGKPVPIVLNSNDWEHGNIDHIDLMPPHAFRRVPTDGFSEDVFAITDQIGPCSPGDVAYPIEATS